jgi:hypothetical protein
MNAGDANIPKILSTRFPIASAVKAASSATGISLVPAVTTPIFPTPRQSNLA